MPALLVLAVLGGSPSPPPCAEELCRYPLGELKLVAVVSGDDAPLAMFEDPGGKGMIARVSSRIGKRGGRVTAIAGECVTVIEQGEKVDVCMVGTARDVLAARPAAARRP